LAKNGWKTMNWRFMMRIIFIKRYLIWLVFGVIFWGLGLVLYQTPQLRTVIGPGTKKVAIVIDDFGGRARGIDAMMNLSYPLTFAVLPFEEFSREQAQQALLRGFEIIIHMPFEAVSAKPEWYGEKYITTLTSTTEIHQLVKESFEILPMAIGLSNHMGSKATAESRVMREVFKQLLQFNRYYLDSKTAYAESPVPEVAGELKLPYIQRDFFLDEINSPEHMRRQLKLLMENAAANGISVGIGHVGPTGPTLASVLERELPHYEKQGFQLVRISDLIRVRFPNYRSQSKIISIKSNPLQK
jgi:polysaccharide deacetylase 2 family uncharacterized protein YibQ